MASNYENPVYISRSFPAVNFGGGTTTKVFRTPKKKRMAIIAAGVDVSTSFTGTTTPGKLQLGDGVTANKYIDLFVGAAGAGTAAGGSVQAFDYTTGLVGNNPAAQPFLYLDPDTLYTITFLAPTGTPAGVADCYITFSVF